MKTKRTIFCGVFAVIFALALAFTACDDGSGGGPGHTHIYANTWSYDATQHWHECTANDGAKKDTAAHTGDPCAICGYDSATSGGATTTALAITTTSLPDGFAGVPYSETLTATGDAPITWSLESGGALPTGLTLAANGAITGTPTAEGAATFTVKAANAAGSATQALTITVLPAYAALYSTWISTTGTYQPYTLTISADTIRWEDKDGYFIQYADVQWGAETANANAANKTNYPNGYTFTGTRTSNSGNTVTFGFVALSADGKTVYLGRDASTASNIDNAGPIFTKAAPTITTTTLPGGIVGTDYSETLTAAGIAPITWSVASGALPAGLTLAATGAITGTPTAEGTSAFTVKAANDIGSATKSLSITIAAAGGNPGDITYTATSNSATDTTAITLTFSAEVTGLTASNITVANGTGSATKGALTGSGASWTLAVTVNTAGNVTVSINKTGIESGNKTVAVYKAAASTGHEITIDMYDSYGDGWNGNAALRINVNGTNRPNNASVSTTAANNTPSGQGSTNTYKFDVNHGDVVQIYWVAGANQRENSFIVYYTDTPPNPAFTSSNNNSWNGTNALTYRLRGTGSNTLDGVSGGTLLGEFTVSNITYTAAANGNSTTTNTTAITLTFSAAVTGLTADDITITGGTGSATKGALTGYGTQWQLAVTNVTAGDITVRINKTGIESENKTVTVYKIAMPTNATQLTENQWANGNLSSGGQQWFTFTATADTQYIHAALGTLTTLYVQVYDSSGAEVGSETNLGINYTNKYISRTLASGQAYYIRVRPYSSTGSGTYRIGFTASTTSPPNAIELPSNSTSLTVNQWANGNIPSSGGEQLFRFTATATASTYYLHFSTTGTLKDVWVQVYDNNGAMVGSQTRMSSSTTITSRTLASGQYYIRVWPYSSTDSGTYQIGYTTSVAPPGKTTISLTVNQFTKGTGEQWFRFTATASTQYIHVQPRTVDLYVQVYDSSGATVGDEIFMWASQNNNIGVINSYSRPLTSGQTYYIRVWPRNTTDADDPYWIAFNTSTYIAAP